MPHSAHGKTYRDPDQRGGTFPPSWTASGEPGRERGYCHATGATSPRQRGLQRICHPPGIQRRGGDWQGVAFHVFDIAEVGPFEERYARLQSLRLTAHVIVVRHRLCMGVGDLDREERAIVTTGGEGCVNTRDALEYFQILPAGAEAIETMKAV